MLFQFGFYSSILLISFTHGLVFSALLCKKGIEEGRQSHYLLSIFLVLCCLYISPWMLGFAGWYDNQPYRDILFYIPFQQLFFIGPVIYCYTKSLLNPAYSFSKKEIIHFLPGIFYLLYSLIVFITDKIVLDEYYFYADGADKDFDDWYQLTGLLSMIGYFTLSLRYYSWYKKVVVQITSYADTILLKWVNKFLYAFLTMQILQVVFYTIGLIYPNTTNYVGQWWYYFIFSFIMYYIAVAGYTNQVNTQIRYNIISTNNHPVLQLESSRQLLIDYNTTIDIDYEIDVEKEIPDLELWRNKILTLIYTEKLYENPELTLTEVSKKLSTNPSIVSKVVNNGFKMNFNNFINHYRIEAVKSMIHNGDHTRQTLLGIAYDCGFNSKATFNRAFKKNTGFSPKEYISQLNS